MAAAAAGDLLAVPIDQDEIVRAQDFAQPDLIALHPETAATGFAHREMAERHVAVAFHVENPAGARRLGQALARCGIHVGHRRSFWNSTRALSMRYHGGGFDLDLGQILDQGHDLHQRHGREVLAHDGAVGIAKFA